MGISTTKVKPIHPQSVIQELNSKEGLPFTDVLSSDVLNKHLTTIEYRQRYYTPDLILSAFLSQAINPDKSCQATTIRIIASLLSKGINTPSANTAAYCKARARLPEEIIANITRESGHALDNEAPLQWLWRGRHVKLVDGSTVSMPSNSRRIVTD